MSRWMFTITKWYIDVVDRQRHSAVAYWTELCWGPATIHWEALSLHQPGAAPVHRWGLGRPAGQSGRDRVFSRELADIPVELVFGSASLGCNIRCAPWTRPFETRLLDSKEGAVCWRCEAPAATVSVDPLGITGDGYVECLTLTLPPWKLPISELRWGRWSSPDTRQSIVWVDWRGRQPLTVVLVDGERVSDARVEDGQVLVGGDRLVLSDTDVLHSRTLEDTLEGLGPLLDRLPASWRAVEDRKLLSRGSLGTATGWAIHETVRFP